MLYNKRRRVYNSIQPNKWVENDLWKMKIL